MNANDITRELERLSDSEREQVISNVRPRGKRTRKDGKTVTGVVMFDQRGRQVDLAGWMTNQVELWGPKAN